LESGRQRTGLSRKKVAEFAGISPGSLYTYENGTRKPRRDVLVRLSTVMAMDGLTRNRMLTALGYEPEPSSHARWLAGDPDWAPPNNQPVGIPVDVMYAEVDACPWPCFLVNSQCEVERLNDYANDLTGIRGWTYPTSQKGPHLLQVMLSPLVRERAVNWPQLVSSLLPDTLRLQIPEQPNPKAPGTFQREVSLFRKNDPGALRELLAAWESASRTAPIRVATPLQWRDERGEVLAFHCFVYRWNALDPYWAIDWHPANAAAWEAIGQGET
jgi:transcriptional regulator with XRE-family HTH domain